MLNIEKEGSFNMYQNVYLFFLNQLECSLTATVFSGHAKFEHKFGGNTLFLT